MASLLRLMLPFAAAVAVASVLSTAMPRPPASGTGLRNESGSTHHAIIDAIDTSAPPNGAGIAPTPGVAGNSS